MFFKCLILLLFSILIDAQYPEYPAYRSFSSCPHPRLDNGKVRMRQRTKLVKFMCSSRYELVGNRYATCRNGNWDVPMPVCVRQGCQERPAPVNSIQLKAHHDAWIITFCMPGYKLVGSSAVYCNGSQWNATNPECIDLNAPVYLSCDFENSNLCGWKQDELHDFDWTRQNNRTPSYFFNTGPSYDHTLGEGNSGYYMYIESTAKHENNAARLLSPIFDSHLAEDGCFSFYYHMFGRATGGLRVYQKPDRLQLSTVLEMSQEERSQYILFEQWGDQGNMWYGAASMLKNFNDSFQIIIEGIRGNGYTSDIAIDDVAILRGENCTNFRYQAPSPEPFVSDTCAGRCYVHISNPLECDCSLTCVTQERCCSDYLEQCVFTSNSSFTDGDDTAPSDEQPQTEKLIGETTLPTSTTTRTPKPNPTTTTPISKPTPKTSKPSPEPTPKPTPKPTIKPTTSTTKLTTTTQPPTTTKRVVTTKKAVATTLKVTATQKVTTKTVLPTTKKINIANFTVTPNYQEETSKKQMELDLQKMFANPKPIKKMYGPWKTFIITVVVLAVLAALTYLAVVLRGNRGRVSLAILRGRLTNSNDSEVRYLNSTDDDL